MGGAARAVCATSPGARDGHDRDGGDGGGAEGGGGPQKKRRDGRPAEEKQNGAGGSGCTNQNVTGTGITRTVQSIFCDVSLSLSFPLFIIITPLEGGKFLLCVPYSRLRNNTLSIFFKSYLKLD